MKRIYLIIVILVLSSMACVLLKGATPTATQSTPVAVSTGTQSPPSTSPPEQTATQAAAQTEAPAGGSISAVTEYLLLLCCRRTGDAVRWDRSPAAPTPAGSSFPWNCYRPHSRRHSTLPSSNRGCIGFSSPESSLIPTLNAVVTASTNVFASMSPSPPMGSGHPD